MAHHKLAKMDEVGKSVKALQKSAAALLGDNEDYTWEELKDIEARRRDILRRAELPFYRMLTYYDGTCLSILAFDPLLWLTMSVFVALRIQARYGLPDYVDHLSSGNIGVIGAFLSFFLVFYCVQTNNRFDAQYQHSMSCKGQILGVAQLARTTLPREGGLRLVRYINAAHVAGYVGLSNTYRRRNFFDEINKRTKMMNDDEYRQLMELDMDEGGTSYRELLSWCMSEVQVAYDAGQVDGRLASSYRDKILGVQASLSSLYNFADQPVSFFYVHFICLLSALYLPLFAASSAFEAGTGEGAYWFVDVINGLIVLLQCIFVLGLRLLGKNMTDPYGDDLEDLSVMHYINSTLESCERIMGSKKPAPLDAKVEDELHGKDESIEESQKEKCIEKGKIEEKTSGSDAQTEASDSSTAYQLL